MISGVEHLFMHLLAISMSSFKKNVYLFLLCIFSLDYFVLLPIELSEVLIYFGY